MTQEKRYISLQPFSKLTVIGTVIHPSKISELALLHKNYPSNFGKTTKYGS